MVFRRTLEWSLLVSVFSCSSGDTQRDYGTPSVTSAEAIQEFLDAQRYQLPPFGVETTDFRPPDSVVSPHGLVRVWLNDAAVESENGVLPPPHAMAVKELGDDAGATLGHAIIWRTGPEARHTHYYCVGPAGRCSSDEPERTPADPAFGSGNSISCGICHGGMIFTRGVEDP